MNLGVVIQSPGSNSSLESGIPKLKEEGGVRKGERSRRENNKGRG
jgi:hypothetical protein